MGLLRSLLGASWQLPASLISVLVIIYVSMQSSPLRQVAKPSAASLAVEGSWEGRGGRWVNALAKALAKEAKETP